jgi:hypothetical protein
VVFLVIRITYAMLSIFDSTDARWNNLSDSIGVFVVMDLIMEYAAMVAWLSVGLMVPRIDADQARAAGPRLKASTHQEISHKQETLIQKMHRRWNERD